MTVGLPVPALIGGELTGHRNEGTYMVQLRQQQRDMYEQMRAMNSQAAQRQAARAGKNYSWQDVPPKVCTTVQRYASAEDPSYCAAREVAATRKAVGDLIASGNCQDALKGALGTGDLQFAREVRDFCGGK